MKTSVLIFFSLVALATPLAVAQAQQTPKAIYTKKMAQTLTKGDFETTSAFNIRVAAAASQPIVGNIYPNSPLSITMSIGDKLDVVGLMMPTPKL